MDLSELVSLLVSKGADYVLSQLPTLISRKEVSREDAQTILLLILNDRVSTLNDRVSGLSKEISELREEFSAFRKEFGDARRELVDRLDFISEQLKVLNTNIATTYELVSKIMAKLMASSMTK